jgi:hypothetical protein
MRWVRHRDGKQKPDAWYVECIVVILVAIVGTTSLMSGSDRPPRHSGTVRDVCQDGWMSHSSEPGSARGRVENGSQAAVESRLRARRDPGSYGTSGRTFPTRRTPPVRYSQPTQLLQALANSSRRAGPSLQPAICPANRDAGQEHRSRPQSAPTRLPPRSAADPPPFLAKEPHPTADAAANTTGPPWRDCPAPAPRPTHRCTGVHHPCTRRHDVVVRARRQGWRLRGFERLTSWVRWKPGHLAASGRNPLKAVWLLAFRTSPDPCLRRRPGSICGRLDADWTRLRRGARRFEAGAILCGKDVTRWRPGRWRVARGRRGASRPRWPSGGCPRL